MISRPPADVGLFSMAVDLGAGIPQDYCDQSATGSSSVRARPKGGLYSYRRDAAPLHPAVTAELPELPQAVDAAMTAEPGGYTMQKSTFAAYCAAALLLSAGVRADDQQSGQPQGQPALPADPIVCHTSMHEGFPRTDCLHQSRWDAMRRKGQEYLRNTQLRAQQSLVHMGPVRGH